MRHSHNLEAAPGRIGFHIEISVVPEGTETRNLTNQGPFRTLSGASYGIECAVAGLDMSRADHECSRDSHPL